MPQLVNEAPRNFEPSIDEKRMLLERLEPMTPNETTNAGTGSAVRRGAAGHQGGTGSPFAEVVRSDFENHEADDRGAIWTSVEMDITACSFRSNEAFDRGGAIDASGSALRLKNAYIGNNQADVGGAIWADAGLVIAYSTVIDNSYAAPGSAILVAEDIKIGGSILDNGLNDSCQLVGLGGSLDMDDSVVTDDDAAAGNQNGCEDASSTNVLFSTTSGLKFGTEAQSTVTDAQNFSQRLTSGSDAEDHVVPSGGTCPAVGASIAADYNADSRPGVGDCDAGADERQ